LSLYVEFCDEVTFGVMNTGAIEVK